MKEKQLIFFAVFLAFAGKLFARQPENRPPVQNLPDTTVLLLSYVENDSELKKLTLAAKKSLLSCKSAEIDNGFDISLSSGNVTLRFNEDGTSITAKPSVKAEFPKLSNLSVSGQTNISSSSSESSVKDTSLTLGLDIISSAAASAKIAGLKAERAAAEAHRKIEKRAVTAEKEFYTELKGMLSSINSIMTKKESLYEDSLDLEAKKIQGYSKSSAIYRQAELKVISDQHEIENAIHTFIYDCVVFYKKCGYNIQVDADAELMSFVPFGIEEVEPKRASDFNRELYSTIENAYWTHTINSMERSTKKTFSLTANAGYTFNNSNTDSNSVDAGLSGTIGGLSLGAGVSVPAGSQKQDSFPTITLSAGISPNIFRKNSLTKQQDELTEQEELLAIEAAEDEYETRIVELQQKLDSLLWEKKTAEENISMYEALEQDMAKLYSQGYISEIDYLSAKNNLNSSIIKKITNLIDLIIYNDEVISYFVSEKFEIR